MSIRRGRENAVIRTTCVFCPNTCGLLAHVRNGTIVKITPGDFPDPKYKWACEKGLSAHHWVYHPERLRYPLRRMGERGEGKWQRVSWDEALDDISTKLKDIAQKHGSTSIAWSIPDTVFIKQMGYLRLLTLAKETFVENWGMGDLAAPNGDFATFGSIFGFLYSSVIEEPKLAIVWGSNAADTMPRMMQAIAEGKKKGCRIVTIDPRLTATASRSDECIQIRPGTDGALALGMIHVILEQGLEDQEFIINNTVGPLLVREDNGLFLKESDSLKDSDKETFMVWDEISGQAKRFDATGIKPALRGEYSIGGTVCHPTFQLLADTAREYSLERVSNLTDIPVEIIRRLAMEYATQKPAAIYRGMGMQRTFYGDLACRAINTLAAITGNLNLEMSSSMESLFLMLGGHYRGGDFHRIPILMLYDAIAKEAPFAVKALCFAGHNFVNQLPNANRIIKELFPRLDFILICDLFMNATARYADYVLPVASFFECTDLVLNLSAPYVQLQKKVIEPLYECKSDFQIAQELGRRMGFGEYFEKSVEEHIGEILASGDLTEDGVTFEHLEKGPVMQKLGELQRKTPTGRIEFYVEGLKKFGQELPVYLEPVESARSDKAKKYPLSLLTPHPRHRIHSTLANVPELQKLNPEPLLEMNFADAEARNISDGDPVYVINDRGRLKVKVRLTKDIKPGVVSLDQGWWPEQYMEGHHNELTHEQINPVQESVLGPNVAYFDVLVDVRLAD